MRDRSLGPRRTPPGATCGTKPGGELAALVPIGAEIPLLREPDGQLRNRQDVTLSQLTISRACQRAVSWRQPLCDQLSDRPRPGPSEVPEYAP